MFLLSGEISADKLRYKSYDIKKTNNIMCSGRHIPAKRGDAMNLVAILPQAGAIGEGC